MNGLTATPPRRTHDNSSHTPTTPRPTPSSSSSSPASHPVTSDAILALHVSAPNPALAALEQAVSERNTLSAQNAQLWKVLEKQRGAYGQSTKDLDRVRAERDAYKAKLHELGQNTEAIVKGHREREKAIRASASSSGLRGGEKSSSGASQPPTNPRAAMARHQSDDPNVSRREQTRESHEPNLQNHQTPPTVTISQPNTYTSSQTTNTRTSPVDPLVSNSETAIPTIVAPPRLGSLPAKSAPQPDASNDMRPLQIPISKAPTDSLSPSSTASPSAHSPFDTPLTATSASISTLSDLTTQHTPPNGPNPSLDVRPSAVSRESAVSLPDEAKRYISNMTESPLPSPRLAEHNQSRSPSRAQSPTSSSAPSPAGAPDSANDKSSMRKDLSDGEFLDMDDEDSSVYESVFDRSAMSSSPADHDNKTSLEDNREPKSRRPAASADDFPLPPSSHPTSLNGDDDFSEVHSASSSLHPAYAPQVAATLSPDGHNIPCTAVAATRPPPHSHRGHELYDSADDRGKDVLSFVVIVNPGNGKEPWTVEKTYGDVLGLDQRVRARVGRNVGKKLVTLPDGKLWKDHAPSRVDQRKAIMEQYLQAMINLPVKSNDEIVAFLTSDVLRETNKPISREGYKEGYLTKRGKNFGGWKTRFFVVQGPVLEYYESRGGTHLGSIPITGAQIGRQQKPADRRETDEESEYRHAFLIIEPRKGAMSSHRHVLCAESDEERDSWVDILVRYVTGSYNDEPVPGNPASQSTPSINTSVPSGVSATAPRSSTSSQDPMGFRERKQVGRVMSKDDIAVGPAVPISQLPQDPANAKLFQSNPAFDEASLHGSPVRGNDASPIDRQLQPFTDAQTAKRLLEKGQPSSAPTADSPLSSSLPATSPLEAAGTDLLTTIPRANSELGHYPDLADPRGGRGRVSQSPERPRHRHTSRSNYQPTLDPVKSSPNSPHVTDRPPSPDANQSTPRPDINGKVKISGPMNGTPIPAGYKFGAKDAPQEQPASGERREKAKSRMFWGFGRPGAAEKPQAVPHIPRAVFGVSIEESLEVAQIASLPAIVFRCIQYLEQKKADQEEGIYRLSGSSAVIKSLKDRFNTEGDVDLLASDEYWDPHAIAGLLKSYFRELPTSILTRDLHMRFLKVIDLVDPQDRIKELSGLIAGLPLENYSLLRALTAHLILIVQNANVNKMTMRNVGIVFSPTLGIPAGVLSLMLGEFSLVFNVEDDASQTEFVMDEKGNATMTTVERSPDISRRNSRQYSDAAADQLLGLSGRKLSAADESQSEDGDEISVQDESGTEATDSEVAGESPGGLSPDSYSPSGDDNSTVRSRASNLAANRGLNITTGPGNSRRHSRVMGLPMSPRPPASPHPPHSGGHASSRSPLHTPK
ncbi:hypothetical protein EVG20_g707 [Dentipellis fragilis]|uniref:RhoGAP-domain-containing protein n=1 Tax=Dentipellis fragilis TaxID=205917 RepID=A0A4Y9ZBT5_9AGAM|nr:hypothetical protein EVG20_g707 [Dentipellis fragilis]